LPELVGEPVLVYGANISSGIGRNRCQRSHRPWRRETTRLPDPGFRPDGGGSRPGSAGARARAP
jgi:hypothetical protein